MTPQSLSTIERTLKIERTRLEGEFTKHLNAGRPLITAGLRNLINEINSALDEISKEISNGKVD